LITDPLGYLELLHLNLNAKMVITDSGGLQEEATVLGVPCITLRNNTERPITCEVGTNIVVGNSRDKILRHALAVLNGDVPPGKVPEKWDGKAAENGYLLNASGSPHMTANNDGTRMKRTRPIRICILGPSLEIVGGQAVQIQRLRMRLASIPELEVSFLPINPRLMGPLRLLQRVKYVRTIVTSFAYGLSLLWRMPRLDIVHALSASYWSFLLAPVPALLFGRLFRKGVILDYRSGEADDHLTRWRIAAPLMRLAHLIVVPSNYLVDVFARHGLKARAVPNFVEIEQLPYRQRDLLRPLFLSNRGFEALYNVSCVLRAFGRIQARMPQAKLVVAGDGRLRGRLQGEARDLGLRNVTFCGAVPSDRMATLYHEADVYLNAPDIDNMPSSILEAAACGLPIVSSDAGGIPYIVRHGVTALLIPRDDDAALAAAALRLFEEPGLASRLAAAARAEVLDRYTWSAAEAHWMDTYRLVARGEAPTGV